MGLTPEYRVSQKGWVKNRSLWSCEATFVALKRAWVDFYTLGTHYWAVRQDRLGSTFRKGWHMSSSFWCSGVRKFWCSDSLVFVKSGVRRVWILCVSHVLTYKIQFLHQICSIKSLEKLILEKPQLKIFNFERDEQWYFIIFSWHGHCEQGNPI